MIGGEVIMETHWLIVPLFVEICKLPQAGASVIELTWLHLQGVRSLRCERFPWKHAAGHEPSRREQ